MSGAPQTSPARGSDLWHEALTMALYVSVVILTGIVALPQTEEPSDDIVAVAAVWGGAAALAVAHVFAFGLATRVVHGVGHRRGERMVALAQLLGALSVAAVVTLPVVVVETQRRFDVVLWILAAFVAGSGYLAARRSGAGPGRALVAASAVLLVGAVVVALKLILGH